MRRAWRRRARKPDGAEWLAAELVDAGPDRRHHQRPAEGLEIGGTGAEEHVGREAVGENPGAACGGDGERLVEAKPAEERPGHEGAGSRRGDPVEERHDEPAADDPAGLEIAPRPSQFGGEHLHADDEAQPEAHRHPHREKGVEDKGKLPRSVASEHDRIGQPHEHEAHPRQRHRSGEAGQIMNITTVEVRRKHGGLGRRHRHRGRHPGDEGSWAYRPILWSFVLLRT